MISTLNFAMRNSNGLQALRYGNNSLKQVLKMLKIMETKNILKLFLIPHFV